MYSDYASSTFRLSTPRASCFIVIKIIAEMSYGLSRARLNIHERHGIEKISQIRKCKGKGLEIGDFVTGGS